MFHTDIEGIGEYQAKALRCLEGLISAAWLDPVFTALVLEGSSEGVPKAASALKIEEGCSASTTNE